MNVEFCESFEMKNSGPPGVTEIKRASLGYKKEFAVLIRHSVCVPENGDKARTLLLYNIIRTPEAEKQNEPLSTVEKRHMLNQQAMKDLLANSADKTRLNWTIPLATTADALAPLELVSQLIDSHGVTE